MIRHLNFILVQGYGNFNKTNPQKIQMPGWGEGCPGGHGDVEASIDGRVTFHIPSRVRLGTG